VFLVFVVKVKLKGGKFLRVICPRCKTRGIIFGKSSSLIKCIKCSKLLVKNTGGKNKVKAFVEEVL
jgi:ribosomal protein S27E